MKAFAFSLALLLPLAAGALDLTPQPSVRELEGVRIPVLQFTDGGHVIRYQPPLHWQVSGRGSDLSLYPPERPESVVKFQVSERPSNLAGSVENLADLEKAAARFVPAAATEITLAGTNVSPFTLGALGSHEFIFNYLDNGRRFAKAVIFVDLDARQRFAMTIHARAGDFETIRREAIASMFSWQPLN